MKITLYLLFSRFCVPCRVGRLCILCKGQNCCNILNWAPPWMLPTHCFSSQFWLFYSVRSGDTLHVVHIERKIRSVDLSRRRTPSSAQNFYTLPKPRFVTALQVKPPQQHLKFPLCNTPLDTANTSTGGDRGSDDCQKVRRKSRTRTFVYSKLRRWPVG